MHRSTPRALANGKFHRAAECLRSQTLANRSFHGVNDMNDPLRIKPANIALVSIDQVLPTYSHVAAFQKQPVAIQWLRLYPF